MSNITWKYVKPLTDKTMVEKYLKEMKVQLPESLVKCLKENNGGRPSLFLINTTKRNEYVFQSLFSYNHSDKNSIYKIYNTDLKSSELYPIAIEAGGDVICYKLKKNKFVLWNHESDKTEEILNEEGTIGKFLYQLC